MAVSLSPRTTTRLRYFHERVEIAYEKYEADPTPENLRDWRDRLSSLELRLNEAIDELRGES